MMAASPPGRTRAFISYSHKDSQYLEQLKEHLGYFARNGTIDFWDDKKLIPGSKWRDEIKEAIRSAKVAILLISPAFLNSDFIATDELPAVFDAAEKEGVLILPVILRPCLFEETVLAQFQTVNDPSQPWSGMLDHERDQVWVRVVKQVKEALKKDKGQWLEEGHARYRAGEHNAAL